jgi:hypothetical protein
VTDIVRRVRAFDAVSVFKCFRVLYVPQPFMRCHKAFLGAALSTTWPSRWPPHHELQHVQQAPRRLDITPIAGVVERDQHMVG